MPSKKILYFSLAIFIALIAAYKLLMRGYFIDEIYELESENVQEQTFLNKMKQKEQDLKNLRPMPTNYFEGKETFETQAIKIVKDKDFSQVAEKPKSPMQQLLEMAKGKDKSPIYLSENDLNKKINLYEKILTSEKLEPSKVPLPGEQQQTKLTRISAPVIYKVFKNENEWEIFLKDHKVREIKTDFSKNDVLILVSNSELPNGIFLADSFKKDKNTVTVYYRVDPLQMSSKSENKTQFHYSALNIPKNCQVKLEQID